MRKIIKNVPKVIKCRMDLFNPLPDDKILDWSKLKQIADNILTLSQMTNFRPYQTERVCRRQFQINENGRQLSKWVENTVGKGKIAHYEQFLLFPQCFQVLCSRHVKTRPCLGKG